MKTSCIQCIAIVSMLAASVAPTDAITSPETNALVSEVEIAAPTAIVDTPQPADQTGLISKVVL